MVTQLLWKCNHELGTIVMDVLAVITQKEGGWEDWVKEKVGVGGAASGDVPTTW